MDAGTVSSGAHSREAATQATGPSQGRLQEVRLMTSVDVRDFARNGEAPADASPVERLDADMKEWACTKRTSPPAAISMSICSRCCGRP